MRVKNSAIIYTGYDYQTLQGIKLLAEWLHSPNQYARMAFEADFVGNEIPKGIDDIVCERPDGIRDFWQVKFTPSPEKEENSLNSPRPRARQFRPLHNKISSASSLVRTLDPTLVLSANRCHLFRHVGIRFETLERSDFHGQAHGQ